MAGRGVPQFSPLDLPKVQLHWNAVHFVRAIRMSMVRLGPSCVRLDPSKLASAFLLLSLQSPHLPPPKKEETHTHKKKARVPSKKDRLRDSHDSETRPLHARPPTSLERRLGAEGDEHLLRRARLLQALLTDPRGTPPAGGVSCGNGLGLGFFGRNLSLPKGPGNKR